MQKVIALDLDGTLAEYHGWKGVDHIGKIIPRMAKRLSGWIAAGHKVVIYTARANDKGAIPYIKAYLKEHGFPPLEVTNIKRKEFTEFWDDRAIGIERNTGMLIAECQEEPKTGCDSATVGSVESALGTQVGGGHYKDMAIQPAEYALVNNLGPAESVVIKYISRHKNKGGKQDLLKCKHMIDMLIEHEYDGNVVPNLIKRLEEL